MKKLVDILDCPQKAEYKSILNEDLLGVKPVQFKICMRKMLEKINKDISKINEQLIDECFNDYFATCVMEKEKSENRKLLYAKFDRLKQIFTYYRYEIIDVNLKLTEKFNDVSQINNTGIIDIVFKDSNDFINCINIREGKIKFSANKIAKKSYVGYNPSCYCIWKLAKAYYKEDVKVGEMGLLAKNEDSKIKLFEIRNFEYEKPKKLDSILVTATFNSEDIEKIEEVINEIHKYSWKRGFIKKCEDKNKCNNCSYRGLCQYQETNPPKRKTGVMKDKAPKKMKFTDSQLKFIRDKDGYIRVIASAGSGKTTCLINRVVHLIQEEQCDIDDFLLITFTEKGAAEIKEKLAYWLNDNGFDSIHDDFDVFTFNSFGNKIIQENFQEFGFTKKPTLIDSVISMKIIQKILDDAPYEIAGQNYRFPLMKMFRASGVVPYMQSMFDTFKSKNINTVEDLMDLEEFDGTDETAQDVMDLYERYKQEMLKNNLIDFSDQVYLALKLLSAKPTLVDSYTYKHIVIDEAQDTSPEQFDLIDIILNNKKTKSFVVVGDDAQAIYSFRGVDMGNLINFDKTYSKYQVKDYYLLDNFRSTKEIIEVADSIIKTNKCNIQKEMIPHKNGERPYFYTNPATMKNEERTIFEAKQIVKDIELKMEIQGLMPSEIAVIARTKSELLEVSRMLNEKQIPNVVAFPEYFIDSPIVAGINGLLNIFVDKDETLKTAQYMQVFEHDEYIVAYDLMSACEIKAAVIKEAIKEMDEDEKSEYFLKLIEPLKNRIEVKSLFRLFEEKDVYSIKERYQYLSDMFVYHSDASYNALDEQQEAVVLTTAHSAKGKEWEYVAILLGHMLPEHCEFKNGLFTKNEFVLLDDGDEKISHVENGDNVTNSKEKIEEQEEMTRLLFVAVTRAKSFLTLVK